MSMRLVCDGCDTVLKKPEVLRPTSPGTEIAVTGARSNNLAGGGLPDGEFHWCIRCARIAFTAVRDAAVGRGDKS